MLAALAMLTGATLAAGETSSPPAARVRSATPPLLQTHCVRCHDAEESHGGFRIDTLPAVIDSDDTADRWRKILGVLNAGDMPPQEEPQLDPTAKTELLDDLSRVLVVARKALADTGGRITMRRVNRREYVNTLEELLGVHVEPLGLPADGGGGAFDTAGDNLFISADQIEQYHEIATAAVQEAWRRFGRAHPSRTHRMEAEVSTPGVRSRLASRIDDRRRFVLWKNAVEAAAGRPENQAIVAELRKQPPAHESEPVLKGWQKLSMAPSPREFDFPDAVRALEAGSRDWTLRVPYHTLYASHPAVEKGAFLAVGDALVNIHLQFAVPGDWPPGDYILRLRLATTDDSSPERRFVEYGPWGPGVGAGSAGCHEVTGTMQEPQTLEIPVVTEGGRVFVFREKGSYDSDAQSHRVFFDAFHVNGIGPPLNIWVDWVEIEGPQPGKQRAPAALAEVFAAVAVGQPGATQAPAAPDVRGMLQRFCTQAFRGRLPETGFLDRLVALFNRERAAGHSFQEAMTEPLAVVLSAPHFLYLVEPNDSQARRQLDDLELASRLSYFLWSGPPDEALLSAAVAGELAKPEGRTAQVDRMLDDPKSRRFVTAFTHQWLGLERLDFFQFKDELHPRYDRQVKAASRQEIFETVAVLLERNLSVRNLLKTDFVVVNALLARYYGLEGVQGDEYRVVRLPEGSPRGGLLGMAAVLAMGSNGEHTSPVERGAWVLRKLLHDPPPPAPPNVPQLTRLEGKVLTARERLLAHQEQPQCASCHRAIDPIGFGLENFDAVGLWRTKDSYAKPGVGRKEWEIEPAGAFHGGPAFKDYFELRDLVAARHADFVTGFTEALLTYALGRHVGFSDDELVRAIVAQAGTKDDAMRAFIHAVVQSEAFRSK
jgi:mono/diheme cytochrome c family protein